MLMRLVFLYSFVLIVIGPYRAYSVPQSSFYPYNMLNGDRLLAKNDDEAAYINLTTSFLFYNQSFNGVYIRNNGYLTFNDISAHYTSSSFPVEYTVIAPFWADVDTRGNGSVYYRETSSASIISTVASDMSNAFPSQLPFYATSVVIATWDRVGYYDRHTDKTNTFQCIIATDGYRSYVIFLYLDNGIEWTTGDASDGENGLGGTPAQVGFNAGDNITYYAVPGSRTSSIVNIETTSNVGVAGMWIFQVNNAKVDSGTNDVSCDLLQVSPESYGGLTVTLNGTTVYSIATYSCSQTGYILNETTNRVCQDDGTWTGTVPSCQLVDCGDLPVPPSQPGGLSLTVSNTVYNSTAQYSCAQVGYELIGSSQRVCTSNGTWGGTIPYCQLIKCGVPGLPAVNSYGLSLTYTNVTYGSTVTYSCIRGYNLVGNLNQTCTVNGNWSDNPPQCIVVDCGIPYLPNESVGGLTVNYNKTIVNSTATYMCNDIGYQLIGEATIFCAVNGIWSKDIPSCQLITCGEPSLPAANSSGLILTYTNVTYSSTVIYSCISGYNIVGNTNQTCTLNGSWSDNPPQCQVVDCGVPYVQNEAVGVYYNSTVVNSTVTYRCNNIGYELIGEAISFCEVNGSWSRAVPSCQIVDCGSLSSPPSQPGGLSLTVSNTVYNSIAQYSCAQVGYELIGNSQRVCTTNGTWGGTTPYCQLINCGVPGLPAVNSYGLNLIYSNVTYGSTVTYSCISGYNIVGNPNQTCNASGKWNDNPPQCHIVTNGTVAAQGGSDGGNKAATPLSSVALVASAGIIVVLGGKSLVTKIRGKNTSTNSKNDPETGKQEPQYEEDMNNDKSLGDDEGNAYSTIDNGKKGNGQGQETNVEGRNTNIQNKKMYDSVPGEETKTRHNNILKKERDDHIQAGAHRKERNGKFQGEQRNKRNNGIHGGQRNSRENSTQRINRRERDEKMQRLQRKEGIRKASRDERSGDYTQKIKETNSDHMQGVKKGEWIHGMRRIWRTRMTCTTDEIRSEVSSFVSVKQICYKTKFEESGKLIWWFVINANEHELMILEKNWHKISSNTNWKLEKCFKPFKGHPQLEHNKHDDNYPSMEGTDIAIEIQSPSSGEDEHPTLQAMSTKDFPNDFKGKGGFHSANKDESDRHQPLLSSILSSVVSQDLAADDTALDMNNATSLTSFATQCISQTASSLDLSHATSKVRSFLPKKLTSQFIGDSGQPQFLPKLHTSDASKDRSQKEFNSVDENSSSSLGLAQTTSKVGPLVTKKLTSQFFDDDQPQYLSTPHTSCASKNASQKESTSVGENTGPSLSLSHATSKVGSFIAKKLQTSQLTGNIGSNDFITDTTADENVSGESSLDLLSHATKEGVSFATKKLHASQVVGNADSDDQSHRVLSNLLSSVNTAVTTQIKESTHDLRHATSLTDLADQCKKKGESFNFMGLGSRISKNAQRYSSQLLNEVESAVL